MSYVRNNQWFDPGAYTRIEWGAIRRFATFYQSVRPQVALTIVLALLASLTAFFIPVLFARIQAALQAQQPGWLLLMLLAYFGILLFQNAVGFGISTLISRIYTSLNKRILLAFYEQLLNTSVRAFIEFKRRSNLFQRLNDATSITGQYTGIIVGGSRSLIALLVFGVVIGRLSEWVLLVLLVGAVALVAFVVGQADRLRRKRARTLGVNYPLVSRMLEIIGGLLTIKALAASVHATDDITGLVSSKAGAEYAEAVANAGVSLGAGSIRSLTVLAALTTSFVLLLRGELALSDVLALYVLLDGFLGPVSELAGYYQGMAVLSVNVKNYYEVFDLDRDDTPARPVLPTLAHHGDGQDLPVIHPVAVARMGSDTPDDVPKIAFRHVHFAYDAGHPVLEDFCMTVLPGEKIALIGKSGAGKTTVLRLLLDFMKPREGEVLVDGWSLRDIHDKNAFRSRFGIVNQNDFLFNISLRDNLRFGLQRCCPDEELADILHQVNLRDDVWRLPGRLDAIYDDNCFSGGQKQRFLIARALLRRPDIILLDEPTSALDFENEREVLHALDLLAEGKTVITIAHRLTTVRRADRVCVLDRGQVVAAGAHDALYEAHPYYRELCDYNSFIV
jgi:ATP-binding cassette subfamily B protein